MSRRRKKNTLLPKMIGIALLINAILLPILAQFGVFKSVGSRRTLTQVELVKLPPAEKKPPVPKKTPKKIAAKRTLHMFCDTATQTREGFSRFGRGIF